MNSFSFVQMGRMAAAVVLILGLNACSTPEAGETDAAQGWWIGDRVAGSPRISIDLTRQVVKYYKGGQLVGAAPISSGREGHGTVRGNYRIIEKDADHRSSLYGSFVDAHGHIVEGDVDSRRDSPPPGTRFLGASMRSFMRITGGIGMHEGYLPGFAASHGCIRLPSKMAAIFFRATPHGTPVEIIGDAPDGHLTTWLPVPHKLRPEDIVIAPKQEEDTRPKAKVAIAEPPPPPAPPKPVEVKPQPVVAAVAAPVKGATQFVAAKPAKIEVASAEPRKDSFWGGLFGGGAEEAPAKPVKAAKAAPAPVIASAQPSPAPPPVAPKVVAEPQVITYQPLDSLNKKSGTSWGWSKKPSAPKPAKVAKASKKAPTPRGQTYFLPGYN